MRSGHDQPGKPANFEMNQCADFGSLPVLAAACAVSSRSRKEVGWIASDAASQSDQTTAQGKPTSHVLSNSVRTQCKMNMESSASL